mmetsp:Transcript_1424/g.3815  ORF Transcript_1424/g.3815 Transcript_1424/m.3815 type:complete len:104 (-) Transcript_1424:274-585(-)
MGSGERRSGSTRTKAPRDEGATSSLTSCPSKKALLSQALSARWANSSVRRRALGEEEAPVSLEEREKRLEDVRQRLRMHVRQMKKDITTAAVDSKFESGVHSV